MHVTLTPRQVEGDRETIPVSWPGVTGLREDQLVYLADGAIRLRVCDPEGDGVECEVEVGGTLSSHKGMNIPGGAALPAATDGDLGWVEFAAKHGVDLLAVSFVSSAADLVPVARAARRARLRHPADRQDRAPAGGREHRGDRRRGDRRDHGRPRRPRDRSAAGRGAGHAEAADPRRRQTLQAGDHRDPDAGLDGHRAAPDPGRGDRRRQRDLRRHRRDHALRGDRGRPAPGRGGAGDGPDRPRHRARPALRRAGSSPAPTRGPRTSPTRSPRARSAPSTGSA